AIWAILIPIINLIAPLLLGIDVSSSPANMPGDSAQFSSIDMNEQISILMNELGNQSWGLIIPLFVIFFLGGYVLYSSLFAAVGSAMGDDIGESQSLTLPISLPVILAVYIMMVVIRQPESNLAVWSSIFPLFSPIVMPARLAFHPPMWQVALSVVLLIATAIFFVWISGRIYRIGILMYGKKVTFREISKWIFYKN
nr:ABC transporter permease [Saprospiraceae bacterium]